MTTDQARAPQGGVIVNGKYYKGGEYIPQFAYQEVPANDAAIATLIALQQQQLKYLQRIASKQGRETRKLRHESQLDKGWKTWMFLATLLLAVGTLKGAKTIYNTMVNSLPFIGGQEQVNGGGYVADDRPLREGDKIGTWVVNSPYGMRMHPIHNEWRMHRGADLVNQGGPTGGQVLVSPWDAKVNCFTEDGGAGHAAEIQGPTHTIKLFHLQASCRSGQYRAGQEVGKVGRSGGSTGDHIHIERWVNGKDVEPTHGDAKAVLGMTPGGSGFGFASGTREAYAVELIKDEEGFRPNPYPDGPERYSWGYGTLAPGPTGTITQEQALADALAFLERNCWPHINGLPVSDKQAAVLASVCFNNGPGAFVSSTIYQKAKQGDHHGAAAAFVYYDKGGIVRNRRLREAKLYLGARQ